MRQTSSKNSNHQSKAKVVNESKEKLQSLKAKDLFTIDFDFDYI